MSKQISSDRNFVSDRTAESTAPFRRVPLLLGEIEDLNFEV